MRGIKIKRWTARRRGTYELRERSSASLLYEVDAYVYCRSIIYPVNHSLMAGNASRCLFLFFFSPSSSSPPSRRVGMTFRIAV